MALPAAAVGFLGVLASWLLSGIVARIIVSTVLNSLVYGAIYSFYRNFSFTSLDYALKFFDAVGFGDVVNQIQYYFNQLPSSFLGIWSYFGFGAMMGFLVNSYITAIFLAWICRKFG